MGITEIRIFSRGGQGGVTAAKLLAYAASLEGHEVQAIPKYGSERKGAPIFVDVRIADHHIRTHSPVGNNADHFIVLEPTLVKKMPSELKDDVLLVINGTDLSDDVVSNYHKVGKVDAYKIADETSLVKSGTRLVSTTMLGAWCKATNQMISLNSIEKSIRNSFADNLAENNVKAIKMAFDQFRFVGGK
ncbi:MAG: 2-oxoacid:acceptor oxidoreductase family protein [Candidatus Hodarchaeales archaeon]